MLVSMQIVLGFICSGFEMFRSSVISVCDCGALKCIYFKYQQ